MTGWHLADFGGAKGAERPDGLVIFYEGEKGAERFLRVEHSDGRVFFFEGERGVERIVRECRAA